MTVEHFDQVAIVTLGMFVLGLIYDAGRKAEKLSSLERWRDEARGELKAMTNGLAEIKGLLLGRVHHADPE